MSIRTKMYPNPSIRSTDSDGKVTYTQLPRTHKNMKAEYGRARPGKTQQDRAKRGRS